MGASILDEARRPALADEAAHCRVDPAEVDRNPHSVERQVRRVLTSQPGLSISSLVVRRVGQGICLTGVVESLSDETDVCGLVRKAAGVNEVINHLLVRSQGE